MAIRRSVSAWLATGLLIAWAAPAAAAQPASCVGSGQVWPIEVPAVRVADGITFVEFDFAGVHPICLADGTQVDAAPVSGHLWQRINADGSIFLRFEETLSYGGGEMHYRGNATFNAAGWNSAVRTVGVSSGPLAGIHGQGTFSPIAPDGSFSDEVFYTYQ